ncbi:PAS domain S-box protein [Thiospirochaeta perfilievii]|uniref:histidine kinase n=1 Tax=Thiospirochaeta perfilievii TaxID=252967 RepID=A0A5C1Q7Q0_9SPIO|nr:ATP-binding protein [Thiospirochaeta perfilievii]QEN04055.1 PAS domain S-box protein [Thiospirochaeta perfilievii]
MPSILIGFDKNFNITQINKEAQKRLEVDSESALGKNLYQVIPKTDSIVRLVEEAIKTNRTQVFHKSVSGNGSIKVCEDITVYPLISSKLEGAVLRIDDITDRVKIEESAIQNEKMLSIGGLAAGMAHEINNPLAGVIQMSEVLYNRLYKKLEIPVNKEIALKYNLDLLSMKKFMEERGIPKMFNSIHESGEQISYIVSNMLSFARKGDAKISTHYIDKIVDETITLAQTDYDIKSQFDFKKIKIIKQYRDDVPPLSCDKTKIQQVILNILRNGAQEMQKSGTEDPHFIISFRENNGSIELEIQDNGPGMDEETKKRIFEPFFTTKGSGFGTGLGLSISYYIIHDNHKGELIVDSEKGHGAKFTIKLPIQSS